MTSTQSQPNPNHDMKITRWFEKSQIVAIGIDNYNPPIEPLNTAANDAKKIVEIFRNNHGFEEIHLLLNEQATRPEINNLLTDLKTTVEENDRLVFYYAGHGIALPSESDPEGYLIPQSAVYGNDETYLSMTDLINELRKVNCRHGLIILDCCYAGAIGWSLATRQLGRAKKMYPTTLDTYIDSKAWQILTSSDEDQKANDVMLKNNRDIKEEGEHSPFAHFLIEGLQGKADLFPQGGDGIITADQLHLYLRSVDIKTAQGGQKKRQTPQLLPFPKKHEKGDFVFLLKDYKRIKEDLKKHSPDPKINDENNPYRGLKSYEKTNADVFFGRTRAIEQLCDQVCSSPLTVVLGVSGSGKSSLVKAGLIPHLMQTLEELKQSQLLIPNKETQKHYEKPQHQEVIKEEDVQVIYPGKSPAAELEKALNKLHLEAIPSGAKCLLVIDQFEEVETQCRDETEQKKFWQKLVSLLSEQQYRDKLHIIFTLRSDFESRLRNKFEKFEAELNKQTQKPETQKLNWGAARFIVQQMEPQELREVTEGPAAVKGVYFTAERRNGRTLVQQLVQEVAGMPGALPLLSFALQEIYRELAKRFVEAETKQIDPPKREISWQDYDKLNGGVPQSITRRATEEYERLTKDNDGKKLDKTEAQARQTMLKWVMLRMVATSGEGLTRRRVLMSELEYPEPNNKYVKPVIARFVEARLIVRGRETESEEYVEPSHDALIREWDMIKNWIDEIEKIGKSEKSETILSLQQRLRMNAAANDWDKNDRDTGFLWHNDPRLPLLQEVIKSQDSWLNQLETNFVKNSVEEKRKRLEEDEKQRDEALQGQISALAALSEARFEDDQLEALIHILKASRILQQLKNSESKWITEDIGPRTEVVLRQILSKVKEFNRLEDKDIPLNMVTELGFTSNRPIPLLNSQGRLVQLNSTSTQELILMQDSQRIIRFWKSDGSLVQRIPPDFSLVKSSSDGQAIAVRSGTGNNADQILLFTPNSTEPITLKGLDNDNLMTICFSPNGQLLASGGWKGWLYLWRIDGTRVAQEGTGADSLNSMDFSPNSEMLATGSNNGTIRLWNYNGEVLREPIKAHKDAVWGVSFSPDGETLASASTDKTVKIWKTDGTLLTTLNGHKDIVRAVCFNSDGQILASASMKGTVRLWKPNGTELKSLDDPHTGSVYTVRFNPEQPMIATTSGQGQLILWSQDGKLLKTWNKGEGHHGMITALDFSPNGRMFVTAAGDRAVKLWRLDDIDNKDFRPHNLGNHTGEIDLPTGFAVSFSSNNQTILLGCGNLDGRYGTLELCDSESMSCKIIQEYNCQVCAVCFSPDGQMFALGKGDGSVELWRKEEDDFKLLRNFNQHDHVVVAVCFSPDGNFLATASYDKTVKLWQIDEIVNNASTTTVTPINIPAHTTDTDIPTAVVRFSPNGDLIATASYDKTVKLWNLDGKLKKTLHGHNDQVNALDFSPDGKILASASNDKTAILWNLELELGLDQLIDYGCDWISGYLTNNPNVSEDDRKVLSSNEFPKLKYDSWNWT